MSRSAEALAYARDQGWPVFPLNGKAPLTPRGFKNATTDHEVIEQWWRKDHPNANIGVRTGSGLLVVDVDERNGGFDTLHELGHKLPDTPSSITGGGGAHFYLHTEKFVRSRNGVWPGIDIKAVGGYVVAPSSTHPSGKGYEWDDHPDEVEVAPAPNWIIEKLRQKKQPKRLPEVIPMNARNDTLFSLGCNFSRRGLTEREILISLSAVAQRCEGEFSSKELAKIARSCARYTAHPWALDAWSYAGRVARFYKLGASACLVLMELYKVADDDAVATIGQRLLAARTLLNQETIGRTLTDLEAHGLLQRPPVGRGKRGSIKLNPNPLPPSYVPPPLTTGGTT